MPNVVIFPPFLPVYVMNPIHFVPSPSTTRYLGRHLIYTAYRSQTSKFLSFLPSFKRNAINVMTQYSLSVEKKSHMLSCYHLSDYFFLEPSIIIPSLFEANEPPR